MPHAPFILPFRARALLVCLIFGVFTYASRHFRLDDALIYARYISHALHGDGLVYNRGENVNALTSILDTWLQLGLAYFLGGRVLLAQAVLSGVLLLAACLIAEWLVPLAGIIVAVTPLFYFCGGMETSLFLFLIAVTAVVYERGSIQWLPTLSALVLLTRFEGGALVAVIAYRLWKRKQYPRAAAYIIPVLLIGTYFAFNWSFYHSLLPQSASAKFGQGMSGFWGRWPTAFLLFPATVYQPFGSAWTYVPTLLIFASYGAARAPFQRRNEVLIPFIVIVTAFCVLANIPAYHWYYAPLVYIGILYASRLIPDQKKAVLSILFLILLVFAGGFRILRKQGVEDSRYVQAGDWLEQNTPANARIASIETGTIGWHCDRYILDIVGLTTPRNATYTAHRDFASWLKAQPDYVVVHPTLAFTWEKVVLNDPSYEFLPVSFGDVRIMRRKTSR